jgi:hypothetical protein
MQFILGIIVGVSIIIFADILLFFLLPALEEPRSRFLKRVRKKPMIKGRIERDRKSLAEIEGHLKLISQLRQFPDTPTERIRDTLFDIREIAYSIESEEYQEIKYKIIPYTEKVDKLHINISLKELLDLLEKNGASKLIEEIREVLSQTKE